MFAFLPGFDQYYQQRIKCLAQTTESLNPTTPQTLMLVYIWIWHDIVGSEHHQTLPFKELSDTNKLMS